MFFYSDPHPPLSLSLSLVLLVLVLLSSSARARREDIMKIFDEIDADDSGTIDEHELKAMLDKFKFNMNPNLVHVILAVD